MAMNPILKETGNNYWDWIDDVADARSEKAELKIAGAKPQRNSGRNPWEKGDGTLPPFLVDVKEARSSFTFNKRIWAKICSDAIKHGMEPALMIAIGEDRDTVRTWIIGDTMFKQMLSAWIKEYGE